MGQSGYESNQQRPPDTMSEIATEHGADTLLEEVTEESARVKFRSSAEALQELRASGIDTGEKAIEEDFLILEMDKAVDELRALGLIETEPIVRNIDKPTFVVSSGIPPSSYTKATVSSRPRLSAEERERMEDAIIADPEETALHVGVTPAGFIVRLFAESDNEVRVTVNTSSNTKPIVVTAKNAEAMDAFRSPFKFRFGTDQLH